MQALAGALQALVKDWLADLCFQRLAGLQRKVCNACNSYARILKVTRRTAHSAKPQEGLQVFVYKDLQGLRTARDGSESQRQGLQVLVYKHLQALQIVPRIREVSLLEEHDLGRFTTCGEGVPP